MTRLPRNNPGRPHGSVRNSVNAWLAEHRKDAIDAGQRLLRSPLASTLTVLVIAISMILPALLALTHSNLSARLDSVLEAAAINLFLSPEVSEVRGLEVSESLQTRADIKAASYISAAMALQEFQSASGLGDILGSYVNNPLPASIHVVPASLDASAIDALSTELATLPEVELVQADQVWIERLAAINAFLATLAQLLALLVALGLLLIVGNSIRTAIAARSDEIRVLKLVGATNGFIARPFLYTGLWLGLGGGVLAWCLLGLLSIVLAAALDALANSFAMELRLATLGLGNSLLLILTGAVIAWTAALATSWHCIREIDADDTGRS